jgi:hypothetical protein
MASDFPEVRLVWSGVHVQRCAVCGGDWPMLDPPVSNYYTVTSLDSDEVPVPVCDQCIERHDDGLFSTLLEDRRRFFSE